MPGPVRRDSHDMDIAQWWPKLRDETRDWLVEHNGEPLDPEVSADIAAVHDGEPRWWADKSDDGLYELPDESIDWIEAWANGETP